jgi:UDP-N-acetylglucosamine--N-acetylmuramyl-(pentapeptide) pyrophosphoryl-undecaprenol N-acetylglucosamine transferase
VTVGTHGQGFERLLEALSVLPADELVVQHGVAPAPPGVREAQPLYKYHEMLDRFRSADKVVMHAGVGSILLGLRMGHTPVVVPRLLARGEHVDDHQTGLASALAEVGAVIPVWDTASLAEAVEKAPRRHDERPPLERDLHRMVRDALTP